ncbi:nucleolysin TIAR-like isoform X2 [Liolophura sinensis]|uniref:nucleolysin TIAR-like isoform X2 n=1 Tax=Liolophura sinensis TaxID=3198878 RepID=UPI003158BE82
MTEDSQRRTLYVGNLDPVVTEDLVLTLFGKLGACKGCKIIHEPKSDPYCFIEFADSSSAAAALQTMHGRILFGKRMKVNWATSPSNQPKQDTSKHFHIFVGDLSPDVETHQLKEVFGAFGEVSDCKIIKDPQTQKSKGYGFVSYINKPDAEEAIREMNGQWLGNKAIRTNWATRKPPAPTPKEGTHKQMSFDEVYNMSSVTNTTVYCGNISSGLTPELMTKTFSKFGKIVEVRAFPEKGYAFIRFHTKNDATNAIIAMNGETVNGCVVRCFWGRESADPSTQSVPQAVSSQQQLSQANYPYYSQVGYWGYPTAATPNQYQNVSQSTNAAAFIPQWPPASYNYPAANWVNVPTGIQQWGQLPMQPTQQQQFNNGQQQGVLGYPMQQGYQQAQ